MTTKKFDDCTSFYLHDGVYMGRIVRLKDVLKNILTRHQCSKNVAVALSETTALATLCSAMLKFDGLFTLQIQGNGPVSLLVCDVMSDGKVRATAKFDENKLNEAKRLRKTEDIIEETPHLTGGGYLALTVDEQNGLPPYQGVVDLKGKNLSEIALRYFKQSEQIDTILKLFVQKGRTKTPLAGGIILQKVPSKGGKNIEFDAKKSAEIWEELGVFVESLTDKEMFDAKLTNEDILHRLFHEHGLQISGQKSYQFGCRCSREKLKKTLLSFGLEEINSLCNKEGKIEATCHFCAEKYVFDKDEFATEEKNLQ